MDIEKNISIVEKQEELLIFPHFDRKDAWELGQLMVSRIMEEQLVLSACIRLSSGLVLFQYMPEGTNANNESWMNRKFNIVRDLELSSLLYTLRLDHKQQTLEERGLDPRLYAKSGGGFPIRIAGTGVIGAVIVSGQPHLVDHEFLVESLSRFLSIPYVPRIPEA